MTDFDVLSGLAKEVTQQGRLGGGKLPVTASVVAAGDTTILTPPSGQSIKLFWASAINRSSSGNPAIAIRLGATELYRAVAVSHWEVFTGAVNAALIVNLSEAAQVEFTAHYQFI